MASKLYRKFIRELQHWVAHDCPMHTIFTTKSGVCNNWHRYLSAQNLSKGQKEWYCKELVRMLGTKNEYPFNKDWRSYTQEANSWSIWKNIARREWLRSQQFKSDLLVEFMRELNSWVDRGMPEHPVFRPTRSTCIALRYWGEAKNLTNNQQVRLKVELQHLFNKEGLHSHLPFNIDMDDFRYKQGTKQLWLHPGRLAFVQRHTKHFLLKQL